MKVPAEESKGIRKKPLKFTRHFYEREASRIDFQKIKIIWENGEIYKEGKNKFRAVMKIGGKTAYIIFYSYPDYNELVTVGVTSMRW